MAAGCVWTPSAKIGANITKEEIKNLLREAIESVERKLDNLSNEFKELKRSVEFLNKKYDDVQQLKQANENIQRQGTSLKQSRKELDDTSKLAQEAVDGAESLAEYLRRDGLEISGVPPSTNYTCNEVVMAVGEAIGIQVKEEDISTSHPLLTFNKDAPSKLIVKFTRRDTRNSFYTNRRKLIDKTNMRRSQTRLGRKILFIYRNLSLDTKKSFSEKSTSGENGLNGSIFGPKTVVFTSESQLSPEQEHQWINKLSRETI